MKTYKERTENILSKIKIQKKRRAQITFGVVASFCLVIGLVLFTPYPNTPPDVSGFRGSLYYELIQKLNQETYEPPAVKNNYEYLTQLLRNELKATGMLAIPEGDDAVLNGTVSDGVPEETPSRGEYVETTDNQVQGVVEGDLVKRTSTHIFYLRQDVLSVYSIAGENSEEIGSYAVETGENAWYNSWEMYLSKDGTRVTIFRAGFGDELEAGKKQAYICVISLDVSDPTQIKEINRQYLTGSYLSSRNVAGQFLLISQFSIAKNALDFEKESTFVPQYGKPGSMTMVAADDIIIPENLTDLHYTVVTVLDEEGLEVTGAAALLSYTTELYVSPNYIFATHSYAEGISDNTNKTVTEITALSYSGEALVKTGTVKLDGSVKNQYSMDEFEGILRVVTSTTETVYETVTYQEYAYQRILETKRNVNLYCVDLETFAVAGRVEAFAPAGETAESVRFDGKTAYVCTAEVITLTDPVYFFDLSDPSNITWKDTGTIDGYSSSLVNFGEYLLGIGFNEDQELKIEVYLETETGVDALCSYEQPVSFSQRYKSYLIDRENQIVGLSVYEWETGQYSYLLLGFDGVRLVELQRLPIQGQLDNTRGLVIDGWLYVLSDGFYVQKIW